MLRLTVRVHPGARSERLELLEDGGLAAWVRAPALEGRANVALRDLLASTLGLRPRQVRIVLGERARTKVLEVDLPGPEVLTGRVRGTPSGGASR